MALKDLLRNFGKKQSATTSLVVAVNSFRTNWNSRDSVAFAKEGYQENVSAYSCIDLRATSVAGIQWKLYSKKGKGAKELQDHKLIQLIRRPNPVMGQSDFFQAESSFHSITGNSFIESAGPGGVGGKKLTGPPMELYVLPPQFMKPNLGGVDGIAGWTYSRQGEKVVYDVSRIMHRKTFHPTDDFMGMSALEAASKSLDTDNAAQTWNYSLLNNMGKPSGFLISQKPLGDKQWEAVNQFVQSKFAGAENAGKVMVLEGVEGGMKWEQASLEPKDMEWLEGRKLTKREIYQALKTPPELVGDAENKTYSNYAEARKAYYTETVLPYMDNLRDRLNMWLVPQFDPKLYLDYDRDDIEALQEDRDKVWTRGISAVGAGLITINEGRELVGKEPFDNPMADTLWIKMGVTPLEDADGNTSDPFLAKDPNADPNDGGVQPPIEGGNKTPKPAQDGSPSKAAGVRVAGGSFKAFNIPPAARGQFWKSFDTARWKWVDVAERAFEAQLRRDFKGAAEVIRASTPAGAREAVSHFMEKQKEQWHAVMVKAYQPIVADFANKTWRSFKSHKGFQVKDAEDMDGVWMRETTHYLRTKGSKKINGITDTTKTQINRQLEDGAAEGEGSYDLANRVTEAAPEMSGYRAFRIARTEVVAASNFGSLSAAKATGLVMTKSWLATNDDRVRTFEKGEFDHLDTEKENQGVALDESFNAGGEALDFPGDSGGSPGNIINCRCTQTYEVLGDSGLEDNAEDA